MADTKIMHFKNDLGVETIEIGVKSFQCCGASQPFDHPHVFLQMGDDTKIVCPYCSTLYAYNAELKAHATKPEGCLF